MREKKRYIHFMIEYKEKLSEGEARDELYNAVLSFIGELGFSRANPKLVEFENDYGILICSNSELQNVKAALALVSKIKGQEGCIRVLKVSGMIGRLQKK